MKSPCISRATPKGDEKMCNNNQCEYTPSLNRQTLLRTEEEIRYGQLWAKIEMPKLLKGDQNQ
jgi:hypothetical protein